MLVVDPAAQIGLVSDVDDTILDTGLTRGLEFLRATLLTDVHERTPLPGAAALYRAFAEPADGPRRPVFYVSTSPWNLHEMLLQFVSMRGFPLGPLLLTDWGPSHAGLFRIGAQAHKIGLVRRLLGEHPRLKLVLVGDSGQEDPEIYAALAREAPDRVAAIYIRHTTGVDLGRTRRWTSWPRRSRRSACRCCRRRQRADRGARCRLGLLDPSEVAAVRAEPS